MPRHENRLLTWLIVAAMAFAAPVTAPARELRTVTVSDGTEVEIRVFGAGGDVLLLGFACDEGSSTNEEATAGKLAADGVEVWMPDLLSAYWLPDTPSSRSRIPAAAIAELAREAHGATGKEVYLMAGGGDAELVLRGLAALEALEDTAARGGLLLFPRLLQGEPEPGHEPVYIEAVGTTTSPLLVLEGGNTPNRWGLDHLVEALSGAGSAVQSLVVPDVRGRFYHRSDPSTDEDVVTSQLHGLIKASLYQLRKAQ